MVDVRVPAKYVVSRTGLDESYSQGVQQLFNTYIHFVIKNTYLNNFFCSNDKKVQLFEQIS